MYARVFRENTAATRNNEETASTGMERSMERCTTPTKTDERKLSRYCMMCALAATYGGKLA